MRVGEGVVSEHQELKAHLLEVLGREGDDRRWGSHDRLGGGEGELVGEKVLAEVRPRGVAWER
jgi:hypothetical protein